MEEQEFIARSQAGDIEAFNQLVERYQQMVYNLARRMLVNTQMAEDAIASGSPGNNPRQATKEEIIELYKTAYSQS